MDDSLHATMQHQDDKPISANTLLEQIKAGSERWLMPWHKGLEAPVNPVTGNLFKGRNADLLWKAAIQQGVSHNQWATLKQWSRLNMTSASDLSTVPAELMSKFNSAFYADPVDAVYNALGVSQ
ncbi:ArdC-like ssDNA-binding domain-containing protein [Idiomarina sp. Sol25]|uniref:ArdC family protein n=1 Tax=Idiomarina sp. Sol25 TaxID=3064000 RepID=UPI00294B92BA|nr:ArdC-like ssDNA-binding domain-containing protein [Idiomarina sp. Sol25]MDV6327059.1 ArdC-like ssDNA-binding domain-containing protein [Idiomarina sp. Sol25]